MHHVFVLGQYALVHAPVDAILVDYHLNQFLHQNTTLVG